jgi:hypothetical protein
MQLMYQSVSPPGGWRERRALQGLGSTHRRAGKQSKHDHNTVHILPYPSESCPQSQSPQKQAIPFLSDAESLHSSPHCYKFSATHSKVRESLGSWQAAPQRRVTTGSSTTHSCKCKMDGR